MHNTSDNIKVISATKRDNSTPYTHPWAIVSAILSGTACFISLMLFVVVALK